MLHMHYTELSKVGNLFGVAAAFGNVHGVYSPGNVELRPVILKNSQDFIEKELEDKTEAGLFCVSWWKRVSPGTNREAISYGAIKMNLDTDLQWAFWEGVQKYYKKNEAISAGPAG